MKSLYLKNKRLAVLFFCLAALGGVNAQQVTIDGLRYYLYPDKNEAVIDKGNTWSGDLEIPSEVCYEGNDYEVKGIVYDAFYDCTELTKVKIPKTISYFVFHHYGQGYSAIAPYYYNAFQGCTSLESIEVDSDNPFLSSIDGVLYSKDGTKLYCYPAGIKAESFVVPESVTWIGGYAFATNQYVVYVELPATAGLRDGIFSDCKKLERVKFPDNLTSIVSAMFFGCTSLKSIQIPSGIKEIETSAFMNCTSLKSVDLPNDLGIIDGYAFQGCTSLEIMKIPLSVKTISGSVFYGCTNLKQINIPEGVTKILARAFENCASLKELDVPANVTQLGAPTFSGCKFDRLIIRSCDIINERNKGEHIFDGMDTSSIIYTPASEVEKYQKVYAGEVYPLEVLGISDVKNSASSTKTIFDLQGRAVKGTPKHGVYVKDGRKVMK